MASNLNMKKAREFAGMSQKQVAIEMKVSAPTVSDWESGKISPSAEKLSRLANLYGCSSDYLLGLTNDPSRIEVGEEGKMLIKTNKPISILAARYNLSADVLSTITGASRNSCESWILGTASPAESELSCVASFLGLDVDELKSGRIPLFMNEEVNERAHLARGCRFAAYRDDGHMTLSQYEAIKSFLEENLKELNRQKGHIDTSEEQ